MLRDGLSSFLILDSAPANFQFKIKETFHTNSILACNSSTFNLVDNFTHIFFSHIFFHWSVVIYCSVCHGCC